jgi:hypothetical protein
MHDLLTGPLGLLLALAGWFLLQAVILPRLGVGT